MKKIRLFLYFLIFVLIFSGCSNQTAAPKDYVDVKFNVNLPETDDVSKGRKITEYNADGVFENLVYFLQGEQVDDSEEGFYAEAKSFSDLCDTNFHLYRNTKYNVSLTAYNPEEYAKAKDECILPVPVLFTNEGKTIEIDRGSKAFDEFTIDLFFNPASTEYGIFDYQVIFPSNENLSLYVELKPVVNNPVDLQDVPAFEVFSTENNNLEYDSYYENYIANIYTDNIYSGKYTLKLELRYNDTNEVYSTYAVEGLTIYPLVTTKGNYEMSSYNRTYYMNYTFIYDDFINIPELPECYLPWEQIYLPEITVKDEFVPYVTFEGWDCVDSEGYTVIVNPKDEGYCFNEYFDVNADVYLYPRFEFNDVSVTYYANNGSEDYTSYLMSFNQPYSLIGNPFEYENYTFLGWAITPDATNPTYSEGYKVETLLKDMKLYAVWNYNGKTKLTVKDKDNNDVFETVRQDYNSVLSLVSNDEESRIFYTKDGSNPFIPENGEVPDYLFEYKTGDNIVVDGEYTLKAIAVCGNMEPSDVITIEVLFNEYTVTFSSGNAFDKEHVMESYTVKSNEEIILPECEYTYAKHHFDCWQCSSNGVFVRAGTALRIQGDVTYTAEWIANGKTSELSFSVIPRENNIYYADYGNTIALSCEDPDAKIYYTTDGKNPFEYGGIEYTDEIIITEEMTIKAYAENDDLFPSDLKTLNILFNEYTVTFSSGNAFDKEHVMESYTVKSNEEITLPECEYTYAKHHFDCWQCSSNGVFVFPGAKITIQSDITYTAQWIANGTTSPVEFSLTPQEDNKCYVNYGTELKITCEDTTAKIYYTTDGSNPYQYPDRVIEYTEPIKLTSEITIKAYAENEDLFGCSVETINILFNEYTISFSSGEANDTEHTVDDIVVKDGKLELPECEYIYPKHTFIGWNWNDQNFKLPGELLDSCFLNITYTACWKENGTTLPVEFSVIPEEGNLCTVDYGTELELSCASEGAKIYYTTDGSNPFENPDKVEYTKPIKLTSEMTITAYAENEDLFASEMKAVSYKICENLVDDVNIVITNISSSFNGLLLTLQRLYDDQEMFTGMKLKASGKEYTQFVWWLNGEIVKDESSNAITSDEITIPFDSDITEYTVYCQAMTPEYDVDDVTYFFKIEN